MDSKQIGKEIRTAIKNGDDERVFELIGSNNEILNMMTPFGTWLHVAASKGELNIVKKLIDIGIDVNKLGGIFGGGALNAAASAGHIEIVEYLLSCGADMDVSEPVRNPLFGAISNGHADVAKLLIESGIDTSVKYTGEIMKDTDAFKFAREQGEFEILKLLTSSKSISDTASQTNQKTQGQHGKILEQVFNNFGPITQTISETVPGSRVTIDVHVIHPNIQSDFITLVTTGMSDEPMDYSNEEGIFKYAELIFKLPSNWIIEKEKLNDQNYYWPISWLRKFAHIPHIYDGWLDEGVILPNGEPPEPFSSNTRLSSILITQDPRFGKIQIEENNINIYSLIPIYEEERNLALEKGYKHLLKKMSDKGISDVLNINRPNVGV
ncbi:suppressor of fused domain protein [Gottfriedia sp. NPDC057991]|uniref:suppressor of fused domain protein n=1 Tax=Gottfriedia sp. NPDC057991 TaxID=3346298 RepID=UPI0036D9C77B